MTQTQTRHKLFITNLVKQNIIKKIVINLPSPLKLNKVRLIKKHPFLLNSISEKTNRYITQNQKQRLMIE